MGPDEQFVSFVLEDDDPLFVHERFADALRGDGFVEFVDVAGDRWPFLIETVRGVVSRADARSIEGG